MTKIADKDTLDNRIAECLVLYDEARHDLNIFMNGVADFIAQHPDLTRAGQELVHSHKRRLKDKDHLAEKIRRKAIKGIRIDRNNFFDEMTDLSGVRILHLFQEQLGPFTE